MVNNFLRYILRVWCTNKIINMDMWRHMNQEQVHNEIKSRKWGWIGHILGKGPNNIERNSLDYNLQGKRKTESAKSN